MREHASLQLYGILQLHSKSRVLNNTKKKDTGVDLNLRFSTKTGDKNCKSHTVFNVCFQKTDKNQVFSLCKAIDKYNERI